MTIPFMDLGGAGPRMLFLHANGYLPECYRPLLDRLASRYHVLAMFLRPLWQGSEPGEINSWHIFSEDLLRFLEEQDWDDALVIGHSLGAVTALRAALMAPARFQALVLLDPVLLPRRVMFAWRVVREVGLGSCLHPNIRIARNRRRRFASLDEAFELYRPRPVFRYLSDENLLVLIRGLLVQSADGGYVLAYSPAWEVRVYDAAVWNDWDLWEGIPRLQVPALVLRGADSDTFREPAAEELARRAPRIRAETIARASHLLPLERPFEIAALIERYLVDISESAQTRTATPRSSTTAAHAA
jgi:pimeloyl-ACP methyl ester carboxylesterase